MKSFIKNLDLDFVEYNFVLNAQYDKHIFIWLLCTYMKKNKSVKVEFLKKIAIFCVWLICIYTSSAYISHKNCLISASVGGPRPIVKFVL